MGGIVNARLELLTEVNPSESHGFWSEQMSLQDFFIAANRSQGDIPGHSHYPT